VDGPIRPSATVVIQPRDGGQGSPVTVRLDFEAAGLGAALLPLVRRQASKLGPLSYRTLKEVLSRGPCAVRSSCVSRRST
jgi:hypothetical protein